MLSQTLTELHLPCNRLARLPCLLMATVERERAAEEESAPESRFRGSPEAFGYLASKGGVASASAFGPALGSKPMGKAAARRRAQFRRRYSADGLGMAGTCSQAGSSLTSSSAMGGAARRRGARAGSAGKATRGGGARSSAHPGTFPPLPSSPMREGWAKSRQRLPCLEVLDLSSNCICSTAGLEALARKPLPALAELRLTANEVCAEPELVREVWETDSSF